MICAFRICRQNDITEICLLFQQKRLLFFTALSFWLSIASNYSSVAKMIQRAKPTFIIVSHSFYPFFLYFFLAILNSYCFLAPHLISILEVRLGFEYYPFFAMFILFANVKHRIWIYDTILYALFLYFFLLYEKFSFFSSHNSQYIATSFRLQCCIFAIVRYF